MSIYRWRINTTWSVYTTEYYSALKGKDTPTPATTWMSLEDVMLLKEARHRRTKIPWFHFWVFHGNTQNRQIPRDRSRLEVTRNRGRRQQE